VAAVVVLYNPVANVLENVRSYLPQVGRLYVVDNSETPASDIVQQLAALPDVTYLANAANLGVATALNSGAELARGEGYDYLLTMDQDSVARPGMVAALLNCFEQTAVGPIAMAAPVLIAAGGRLAADLPEYQDILFAMTSGCLLKLSAYASVGPFMDELFVDYVDIEYSMRLCRAGFTLVRAGRAVLEHNVGHQVPVAGDFTVTTHSPLRMYYKTRNRMLIWKWYGRTFPGFCWVDRLRIWRELLRLICFEPDKGEKLIMMARGFRDFRRQKLGKYVP
jgi:rhamnosyltransferase